MAGTKLRFGPFFRTRFIRSPEPCARDLELVQWMDQLDYNEGLDRGA